MKKQYMNTNNFLLDQRLNTYQSTIIRLIALWIFTFCVIRLWEGALPNTFYPLNIAKPQYDLSYWLIRLTHLDQIILNSHISASLFTLSLLVSLILVWIFPLKWYLGILAWIHLFLLYALNNLYIGHAQHYLSAPLILLLMACLPLRSWFKYAWEGMRFFVCWLYGSAFIWKVIFGAFGNWGTGVETVKNNMAAWMFHHPNHFFTELLAFGIKNPFFFNFGHQLIIIIEGFFLIGFFTKKWDSLLIIFAIIIFLSTSLFSDVFFVEQLIIILPLISVQQWEKLQLQKLK